MKTPQRTANHNLVRHINRALILSNLRRYAPQSRAELAERTGLTRSTVSSLVDELSAANLIHEIGIGPSRGGRPGTRLELNPAGGSAIGVEITRDSVLVMLTDFVARPRWHADFELNDTDPDTVIAHVERLIESALDYNADHERMRPLGIGLGITGLVNAAEGTLTASANLGWRNVPFRTLWQERFGLPVHVGNEASIAALGEHYFGAAQTMTDFIYLGIGTTAIGSGLFINGELYRGIDGYGGEVGHTVIDPAGPLCTCGKHGCWEALLRAVFNKRSAASLNEDVESTTQITTILSTGIANLINVFNPQLVVLGGPVGRALAPALPTIRARVAEEIVIPTGSHARIELSQITSNACVLGAVALVLDDVMGEPVRS